MSQSNPITLIGAPPSPYTRKMIALMRYRHIDYRIVWGDPVRILAEMGVAKPQVALLPVYVLPDEAGEIHAVCDSTPIIRRLEAEHKGRSVIPTDPVMAFIDYLLEDFADEWCTKYMFHYRWHFEADADNAGTLLPLFQKVNLPADTFDQYKPYILSLIHISEPTRQAEISYAVFCLKKKKSDKFTMAPDRLKTNPNGLKLYLPFLFTIPTTITTAHIATIDK